MNDAVVNALIAGSLALLGALAGAVLAWRGALAMQRRADVKVARTQLLAQAELLVRAVVDIRAAGAAHDTVWISRRNRLTVLMLAMLEVIPWLNKRDSRDYGASMARAAGVVWDWHLRGLEAMPRISESYSRMTAAAFQLTLSPHPQVVEATRRVSDAVYANIKAPDLDKALKAFRDAVEEATIEPQRRGRAR